MRRIAFGKLVRERRMDKGISLRKLAELCGISPTFLSHLETGNANVTCSEDVIRAFAVHLHDTGTANPLDVTFDLFMQAAGKVSSEVKNVIVGDVTMPGAILMAKAYGVTGEQIVKLLLADLNGDER
jgi:HTH-type transcriptional regulator, competence development regulator